jgi:hypothetical protein
LCGGNPSSDVHFHDVATFGVADFADAVGIRKFSHVAGIGEMIHHLFTIESSHNYPLFFPA